MTENTKPDPVNQTVPDSNNSATLPNLQEPPAPTADKPKALPLDVNKAITDLTVAISNHFATTGELTVKLLTLVVICFTGLAGMSLYLNHIDTAEKIVIGLISFLSGAAIFSGPPKK